MLDYFLCLDIVFEIGFVYSCEVKQSLFECYFGSQDELCVQGVVLGWCGLYDVYLDSVYGVVQVLDSFVIYY